MKASYDRAELVFSHNLMCAGEEYIAGRLLDSVDKAWMSDDWIRDAIGAGHVAHCAAAEPEPVAEQTTTAPQVADEDSAARSEPPRSQLDATGGAVQEKPKKKRRRTVRPR